MPKGSTEQFVGKVVDTNEDFEKRLNNLETTEASTIDPPNRGSHVYRNISNQTNATNTYQTITYEGTLYGVDISAASGVFTCVTPGRYLFNANITYTTTGSSKFRLLLNGTDTAWEKITTTVLLADPTIVLDLDEGDTVALQFANNGSGTVTIAPAFGNLYLVSFQSELLAEAT